MMNIDKNINKKEYTTPVVRELDISDVIQVAASRSGMGMCKYTFID